MVRHKDEPMAGSLTTNEEAQLAQTIEMFEVITQSQPLDYQSLEILKEAYYKLQRQKDVVNTSKRIAQAYVQLGQLSSAILEYESILQRYPDDPDVKAALLDIEARAGSLNADAGRQEPGQASQTASPEPAARAHAHGVAVTDVDDGRMTFEKLFVDGRLVSSVDFNQIWQTPSPDAPSGTVQDPFIQILSEKGLVSLDRSLKLLSDRARIPFLPLDKYDVDMDLARSFPRDICQRWCILPFDRMSKSVQVATANPFNQQAAWELENATRSRLLWYLTSPVELVRHIRRVFR